MWMAETVITTQHRSWAWIFVGAERRDQMVQKMHNDIEDAAKEKQDLNLVKIRKNGEKARSIDELIKVEDISGQFWKGKKMYVYDPTTIKIMTPHKPGEGERISSMVTRTGAVAGVNGGAFDDPEGLGNGFAAIGFIISDGEIIFTDKDGSIPQHIVGFTREGQLVVGKYDAFQLRDMGVSEAVSFYPRLIANGKPLITNGDGGWGRAPRTAVGQKADGTVIFLVIDGRQSHSVGATLKELQDLFLEEGVVNAGNLDGGASSELVVDGELLTKPSSRYGERRLPSAFLVYDDPSSVKATRVWDGVDKIDAGGSHDHPDFLREQAEKKARQQQGQTTPKTTDPKDGAQGTQEGKTSTPQTGAAGDGNASGGTASKGKDATNGTGSTSSGTGANGKATSPAAPNGTGASSSGTSKQPTNGGADDEGSSSTTGNGGSGSHDASAGSTRSPNDASGASSGANTGAGTSGSSQSAGTPATQDKQDDTAGKTAPSNTGASGTSSGSSAGSTSSSSVQSQDVKVAPSMKLDAQ